MERIVQLFVKEEDLLYERVVEAVCEGRSRVCCMGRIVQQMRSYRHTASTSHVSMAIISTRTLYASLGNHFDRMRERRDT